MSPIQKRAEKSRIVATNRQQNCHNVPVLKWYIRYAYESCERQKSGVQKIVCPCAPTSFPLSFHHTPCRLRVAKIHKTKIENKKLVKKYLADKARYLARQAKYLRASAAHDDQSTAVFVSVVSSDSEVLESPSCNDTSIKPMKPLVLFFP
jgi:hypothetical protein